MWRYLVGAVGALLLCSAGLFWFRGSASPEGRAMPLLAGATAAPQADTPLAMPPAAAEKTREEKRFARYDKDRNGAVTRDEYLASRHNAFAKLDLNGDGTVSFDEYAAKATSKFAQADADKSGTLSAAEFATTRVARKQRPRVDCPPAAATRPPAEDDG